MEMDDAPVTDIHSNRRCFTDSRLGLDPIFITADRMARGYTKGMMRMLKRRAEGSEHALTMIFIFWGMVKNPSLDYAAGRKNLNATCFTVNRTDWNATCLTVVMVDLNTIMPVVNLLIIVLAMRVTAARFQIRTLFISRR